MDKIKVNLFELLLCISNAQDLVSSHLYNHHQQVAYLSYCLAKELNLTLEQQQDILLAAMVHDIGALSANERLETLEIEPLTINNHAFIGAKLLGDFKPLHNISKIIKYHHLPWEDGKGRTFHNETVLPESHVIHLADRVCTRIHAKHNVLSQLPQISDYMNKYSRTVFEPGMVEAMEELVKRESIWLDLVSAHPIEKIDTGIFDIINLEVEDIIDLAMIFSQIIDFRSSFTARHSAGVATTAAKLAQLAGFPVKECKMMLVAGYLHDLGKLAIDNKILEKPGKLTEDEYNQVRSHTYYTYQLLGTIPQFKTINLWASYHHERLDGKGYPFHIKGEEIPFGSRIMAVADVFTAIKEDRPYRKGMNDESAMRILGNMVTNGALDARAVGLLTDNFQMLNVLRENSQKKASRHYEDFLKME